MAGRLTRAAAAAVAAVLLVVGAATAADAAGFTVKRTRLTCDSWRFTARVTHGDGTPWQFRVVRFRYGGGVKIGKLTNANGVARSVVDSPKPPGEYLWSKQVLRNVENTAPEQSRGPQYNKNVCRRDDGVGGVS